MKKILTVITMIAILALSTVPGLAAQPICVYPTGDYPDDVGELDSAINGGTGPSGTVYPGGGTLRLKATDQNGQVTQFNLGDGPNAWHRGSIQVFEDVKLLGETVNGNMTTVYGGFSSFHTIAQVNITIEGICFDGALMVPFSITNCKGATIRGNKFMNLRAYGPEIGLPWAQSYYIFVTTEAPPFDGSITGNVVIEGNEIIASILESDLQYNEMVPPVPVYKAGVVVAYADAYVLITKNTISGDITEEGVIAWENNQHTIIKKNYIKADFPNLTLSEFGDGILAWESDKPAGVYYIIDNTVICENPRADGIALVGPELTNSMVSKNKVTMYDSTFGAISLYWGSSDNTITQNKITGSACWALGVEPRYQTLNFVSENNTFVGNNISRLNASVADVFFNEGTNYSTVVGYSGTVFDHDDNVGNVITGYTKRGIGREIRDAIREAVAKKQEAKDLMRENLNPSNWPNPSEQ